MFFSEGEVHKNPSSCPFNSVNLMKSEGLNYELEGCAFSCYLFLSLAFTVCIPYPFLNTLSLILSHYFVFEFQTFSFVPPLYFAHVRP